MLKKFSFLLPLLFLSAASLVTAQPAADISARLALLQRRGAGYLLSRQLPDGAWMHHPAITSLACLGIVDTPEYNQPEIKEKIAKALDFVIKSAQPDGSLSDPRDRRSYPVYTTSICLIALARFNRPEDQEIIRQARDYLLGNDIFSEPGDGSQAGIGYGRRMRADLSNTAWALEALHVTDHLDREPISKDPQQAKKADLAWEKALQFITHCQNLTDTHQSAWLKSAPAEDKGGFIYCPSDALKEDARPETLRSYGSMTYAGLKSLIYAKVSPEDIRIKTAWEWIQKYYTVSENPGVGDAGYYYYLHTFGKALGLLGRPNVTDAKGTQHDWRQELIAAIAERQKEDGSWVNEQSGRWMESAPELVTSYVLMTLGNIKEKNNAPGGKD